MSTERTGRLRKSATILPLALLSAAWTASLTGAGTTATGAAPTPDAVLPDGTSVPSEAIEAPASVSGPSGLASGDTQQIVATATTNGIPSSALAAYLRAETVINSADKSCNLTWQLVAAIGRVESNHGRFGGNALDDDGLARPGIYGIALNGKNNTTVIRDTDAGQYDNDIVFDRAVGPMQFIPSTWSVVGVDADNDGQRNPQDIDDAALATAVYLCSGKDDLATVAGQRSSVYRYNHSQSYVDLVLSIMNAYLEGDFMSVPNSTTAAGTFVPDPVAPEQSGGGTDKPDLEAGIEDGDTSTGGGETDGPDTEIPEPEQPDGGGGNGGGGNGGGGNLPTPEVNVPNLPSTSLDPADETLTLAQAIVQCTLDGYIDNPLDADDEFDVCVEEYTTQP